MNLTALLSAIAIIESSDARHPAGNDLARGRKGEVSRYQIMPATWRAYGGGALVNARNPAKAKAVALMIIDCFPLCHNETDRVLCAAILWNRGPQTAETLSRRIKHDSVHPNSYSMRVWNQYQAIKVKVNIRRITK